MATFADLLRTFRVTRGLSQARLARRAQLDHSYLSRLEAGTRVPSRDTVLQLCTALRLSLDETDALLIAAGYTPRHRQLSCDPLLLDLADVLERPTLPPDVRAALTQSVRAAIELARAAIETEQAHALVPAAQ